MVFNQLQFEGMPRRQPSSPAPESPAPSPQQVALQRNRDRITGTTTMRSDSRQVPVHRFGLSEAADPPEGWASYESSPTDTYGFRRYGETRMVPLVGPDAPKVIQPTVDPLRVKQIAQDPETGRDARFPGPEIPHAVEFADGTVAITNGTHRTAADVAYRGKLFGEVRVLPHERVSEAPPPIMQQAKNLREMIGYERQRRQDPTYGGVRRGERI